MLNLAMIKIKIVTQDGEKKVVEMVHGVNRLLLKIQAPQWIKVEVHGENPNLKILTIIQEKEEAGEAQIKVITNGAKQKQTKMLKIKIPQKEDGEVLIKETIILTIKVLGVKLLYF